MRGRSATTVVVALLVGSVAGNPRAGEGGAWALRERHQPPSSSERQVIVAGAEFPIELSPATLADGIDSLAGLPVRLPSARIAGVFDPRIFAVESRTPLRPLAGNRNRVLVITPSGTLRVAPALLLGSTVTVSGTARTLLGVQVGQEVPWPAALTRDFLERHDIRAALLATSVTTPEGDDLLLGASPVSKDAHPSR